MYIIVDSEHFERSPSEMKKKYKFPFQVDFQSSVVKKETVGTCNIRPSALGPNELGPSSAPLTRHYRHEKGSAHETQDKAEDCFFLQTE